jgi:hypothetical protein
MIHSKRDGPSIKEFNVQEWVKDRYENQDLLSDEARAILIDRPLEDRLQQTPEALLQ